MCTDPAITELLESACPSIKYRVRSEILGQSVSSKTMVELHAQILLDSVVREVLGWQQSDGWLGWDFHGAKSIEAGIRILSEKGVRRCYPALAKALVALEKHTERLDRGIGKVGKILDEKGFGGSLMIRATVFAYTGLENKAFVKEQIGIALTGFKTVLAVESVEDLVETYRDKLVFRPNIQWPSIYHLRLLAFTHSWRTSANKHLVTEAVKRLIALSPLPRIYVRSQSQWIAPASFCMHDFAPRMNLMDDAHWMMWFHRMECLARLGVVNSIPELQKQVMALTKMLDTAGRFTKKLIHPYFTKWGGYPGLMLEANWRTPEQRVYDLTFRSKLILHFAAGAAA
jgi:hypothetical protein